MGASAEGKMETISEDEPTTLGESAEPSRPSSTTLKHKSDGRIIFPSQQVSDSERNDPFKVVFTVSDFLQEYAIPLIVGAFSAMILANADWGTYEYYFTSDRCDEAQKAAYAIAHPGGGTCHSERWTVLDAPIFGHSLTLHFLANDIVMCFHFGLAMKEVTEALLPGGSLNPPSKAMNPVITTLGGIIGPVAVYFILLKVFMEIGWFDKEQDAGLGWDDLMMGWGIVTATDIVLAWLVARLVFGDGHPAIDYLLLLAVGDDAIGMGIIAIFYPDPDHAVKPIYLLFILLGMFCSWLLRRWHFRMPQPTHQEWQPYIIIGGILCWCGLIKAHLHPALALIPIIPFMPGPNKESLDHLDEDIEQEEEATFVSPRSGGRSRAGSLGMADLNLNTDQFDETERKSIADIMETHHEYARGRALTIQAGLFGGLAGHDVDKNLMVEEIGDDGELHLHSSTLDEFEHFWKVFVDVGLGLFALVNAGVKIEGFGAMTALVLVSLIIGKFGGILMMYKLSKLLGFPPPLGIRTRHVRMIGMIASIGLIVAIFVSDVAFTDKGLQGDAKLGALLSAMMAFVCIGVARFHNFSEEDVNGQIEEQITEELADNKAKSKSQAQLSGTDGLSTHCEIEQPASGEASSINIEMDEDEEKEKKEKDRVSIEQ